MDMVIDAVGIRTTIENPSVVYFPTIIKGVVGKKLLPALEIIARDSPRYTRLLEIKTFHWVVVQVPQQKNGYSCGVYLLKWLENLCDQASWSDERSYEDLDEYGTSMIARLIKWKRNKRKTLMRCIFGNRLSLMVTLEVRRVGRNIATEFTPTIGQTFATLDEGIQFYETYAIACGFEPRKSSTKRFRSSGDIRTKLIVCHREGFRDSKPTILPITGEEEEPMVKAYNPKKTKVTRIGCKARIFFKFVIKEINQVQVPLFVVDQFHAAHNHRLSLLKYREFQKKCRNLALQHKQTIVDNCKVNIGPTSTFRSVKEYVDGYENIGASLTEFKNFGREIKCFIGLKDAQMFVDQLETLHETQEGFYYAYDIDQNKCLFRVFWADAAARRNYALYGEAVTFDPTYSTNKYDMIFAPFTGVDYHKKSVTFGATLMSRENDQNFKWIFTKFLDCMGGKEPHCFFTDQCPAMKIAVPCYFTIAAHHYCMWHIMKKLLEKRQCWIPAYYRDIPLGCLLRTTQRSESENSFFKRFENPHGTLVEFWMRFQSVMDQQRYTQKSLDRDSDHSLPQTKTLLSLEVHASTVYTHALFYEFQQQCVDSLNSCSLWMFERKGYICKHIIWILSGKGIKKIPDKYLLSRWTKNTKKMPLYDVHGQLLDDFTSSDTFRQNFKSGAEKLTKHQELEMLLGVNSSSEVRILPPVQSKNKGTGKRLMSKKDQSVAKAQKPKRFCNNCKQMAHHDKRNCPNPAVDTSQHSFDHESDISSLVDSD
ncbi:protein FAR1-RELATED SEQUENCE 5-like [Silene latifolia]|uniref:protein FAR1-RELATED SEQUENCE 5-like n=1 Tax=Silene latifolia TaxID=37657 RepID=UPI003D77E68F